MDTSIMSATGSPKPSAQSSSGTPGEPPRHSGASVSMQGLTKSFGPITAVDDVSLHLGAGEFVSLLGPSGSGKTTVLMMLAGFEHPDEGTIGIGGTDVTESPPYDRGIGMVFQSYALFPHMTVFENVAYALRLRKVGRQEIGRRVRTALDMVRLPADQYADRLPKQLSGGQRQRVALVRALVYEPKVLLMDEPMGALDKNLREELKLELIALQERLRLTILYVTHDQGEALMLSDRVAVMRNGRIEQIDDPETLYHRPTSEFVARFLGDANLLPVIREADGKIALPDGHKLATPSRAAEAATRESLLMIRPEDIDIVAEADGLVSGRVAGAVFLGEAIRTTIETPIGELTVMAKSNRDARPRPGDTVHLRFDPDATALIPQAGDRTATTPAGCQPPMTPAA